MLNQSVMLLRRGDPNALPYDVSSLESSRKA